MDKRFLIHSYRDKEQTELLAVHSGFAQSLSIEPGVVKILFEGDMVQEIRPVSGGHLELQYQVLTRKMKIHLSEIEFIGQPSF